MMKLVGCNAAGKPLKTTLSPSQRANDFTCSFLSFALTHIVGSLSLF